MGPRYMIQREPPPVPVQSAPGDAVPPHLLRQAHATPRAYHLVCAPCADAVTCWCPCTGRMTPHGATRHDPARPSVVSSHSFCPRALPVHTAPSDFSPPDLFCFVGFMIHHGCTASLVTLFTSANVPADVNGRGPLPWHASRLITVIWSPATSSSTALICLSSSYF